MSNITNITNNNHNNNNNTNNNNNSMYIYIHICIYHVLSFSPSLYIYLTVAHLAVGSKLWSSRVPLLQEPYYLGSSLGTPVFQKLPHLVA